MNGRMAMDNVGAAGGGAFLKKLGIVHSARPTAPAARTLAPSHQPNARVGRGQRLRPSPGTGPAPFSKSTRYTSTGRAIFLTFCGPRSSDANLNLSRT